MSKKLGRGHCCVRRWIVEKTSEEDWILLGRWLPQETARQALASGMYSDGTVIDG